MRSRMGATVLAGAVLGVLMSAVPAAAQGATVIIERGGSSCFIAPGDLPGLTAEFQLASSTVTITPNGMLVVTCTGILPQGYSVPRTLTLDTLCTGDTATTTGRLIATVSGRVSVMCRFPA